MHYLLPFFPCLHFQPTVLEVKLCYCIHITVQKAYIFEPIVLFCWFSFKLGLSKKNRSKEYLFVSSQSNSQSRQRSWKLTTSKLSIWDGAEGCQGDCGEGFGLSRTAYPVETRTTTAVRQQSANAPVSRSIVSLTKIQARLNVNLKKHKILLWFKVSQSLLKEPLMSINCKVNIDLGPGPSSVF